MLVLGAKVNEPIYIGDRIVVQVLEIKQDGSVRLGIQAPREVTILRDKVKKRIEDGRR